MVILITFFYQSVNMIYFTQTVNVVGSGALTTHITTVLGSPTDGIWFTQVLAILTAILSIPVTQAADFWDRKIFLVILTTCGCIGSSVVSRANGIDAAIAGIAITGLSFGAQPLLHAVSSEILARKHRSFAQASVNVASALGAILGLVVGGALTRTSDAGFRVYWGIVAGIYAVTAIICQLFYNPPPRELQFELTWKEKIRRLDWIGYSILAPALVLFCMALSWSQNPYQWTNTHVLVPFIVGVVLVIVLVIYETIVRKDAMFLHDLFRHRNFPIALGCVFAEGIVFFCGNNYFAYEVSVLFFTDSLITGVHYAVAFIAFAISSLLTALWSSKIKKVRIPCATAYGTFVIFNILMATVSPSVSEAQIWVYPLLLGTGLGMCLTTLMTAAQFATPRELIAITSGVMISVRSLGGAVGLAVYNAIFSSRFASNLPRDVADAVLPLNFSESRLPQLIQALIAADNVALSNITGANSNIISAAGEGLRQAKVLSFRYVWVSAGFFSLAAAIGESTSL
jgi:hypothetical protein